MTYITHWKEEPGCGERLKEYREELTSLIEEAHMEDDILALEPRCYDFEALDEEGRRAFQKEFWDTIAEATMAKDTELDPIHTVKGWGLMPVLRFLEQRVRKARDILDRYFLAGQMVRGMNMTRLRPFPHRSWADRLVRRWREQLTVGKEDLGQALEISASLNGGHPLAPWWNGVLLRDVHRGLEAVRVACERGFNLLCRVPEETPDLDAWLQGEARPFWDQAHQALVQAEVFFPPSLSPHLAQEKNLPKVLATQISISLCRLVLRDAVEQLDAS